MSGIRCRCRRRRTVASRWAAKCAARGVDDVLAQLRVRSRADVIVGVLGRQCGGRQRLLGVVLVVELILAVTGAVLGEKCEIVLNFRVCC